jgi:predicted RNA-binding Zn-ribbon protein involved in translation (DUF1610 family)
MDSRPSSPSSEQRISDWFGASTRSRQILRIIAIVFNVAATAYYVFLWRQFLHIGVVLWMPSLLTLAPVLGLIALVWTPEQSAAPAPSIGRVFGGSVRIERQSGLTCTSCSRPLPLAVIDFRTPFECPSCGARVRVRRQYNQGLGVVSILATLGFAYVFGVQGVMLILAVILGFFPVAMLVSLIARRLIPPTLVICEENETDKSR